MKSYSPYDNLAAKAYPAMLVKTSFDDSQVMYWEPAKYVAKLRTPQDRPEPADLQDQHGGRPRRLLGPLRPAEGDAPSTTRSSSRNRGSRNRPSASSPVQHAIAPHGPSRSNDGLPKRLESAARDSGSGLQARTLSGSLRGPTDEGWEFRSDTLPKKTGVAVTLAPDPSSGPTRSSARSAPGGMGEVYRAKDPRLCARSRSRCCPRRSPATPIACAASSRRPRRPASSTIPTSPRSTTSGRTERRRALRRPGAARGRDAARSGSPADSFPQRKAIDYALQIAHGLAAAHDKGIVHRDLKPENLFVTQRRPRQDPRLRPRQADAGRRGVRPADEPADGRRAPSPGVVLGTLGYMSPEQIKGKPADARSDIFSFGAILYEMLSGKRAFHADSAGETMAAILKEDPPDLSVTNQTIAPGPRAHRPPLPREEPRAALPLRARSRLRHRGALGHVGTDAAPARFGPSGVLSRRRARSAGLAVGFAVAYLRPSRTRPAPVRRRSSAADVPPPHQPLRSRELSGALAGRPARRLRPPRTATRHLGRSAPAAGSRRPHGRLRPRRATRRPSRPTGARSPMDRTAATAASSSMGATGENVAAR